MKTNLFRKTSIDKISSPEELNDYIRVTNGGVWILLIGLSLVIMSVMIWSFVGVIPESLVQKGLIFASNEGEGIIYSYVPMSQSRRIKVGMEVQISPEYAPREEFGYAYGIVDYVGASPVMEEDLIDTFGSLQLIRPILADGNPIEVRITLIRENSDVKWSSFEGNRIDISMGSYCDLLIVVSKRRPYELLFR